MPITLPVATLIGTAFAATGQAVASKNARKASNQALATESKYSDEALADARAERARQQKIDDEDRRLALEDRSYSRQTLADQLAYRTGRDSIEDARFNDERDYGRGEFQGYKSRLAPFSQAGTRSVANLSSVVGRALPAAVPTAGNGGMVRLQSPTGQVQEVPADHLEHYLKLGAVRV